MALQAEVAKTTLEEAKVRGEAAEKSRAEARAAVIDRSNEVLIGSLVFF